MATHTWTLVRKIKPEHVDDHAGFVAERDAVNAELANIGLGALLLSPSKRTRRRQLRRKLDLLERQIKACHSHPGSDLKPPRIGMDAKATDWFKKRMAEAPDAWPLPPEEMLEEMHGHPVWELTEHRELQQLDTDWPTAGFPVPDGPGFSLELTRRLHADISADDAKELAGEIHRAVDEHLRRVYPELAKLDWRGVVDAIIRGSLPGHPPDGPAAKDLEEARKSLSGSTWLRFWGEHGYALRHASVGG